MARAGQRYELVRAPEPHGLAGLLAAPAWLREFGPTAWLAVGVTLFVAAVVGLLALTRTIVMPVLAATVVAAVTSPLIARLERRGLARGFGAALLLIGLVVFFAAVVGVVLGGITSQLDELRAQLSSARETLAGWLADLGIERDTANAATDNASSGASAAVGVLLEGVAGGLQQLSSLVVLPVADGVERVLPAQGRAPDPALGREAHAASRGRSRTGSSERVLESLRGYFVGVTLVAAFNAVVVGIGALLLDVPLAGTIAVVTFLGAYVPYLGAWAAGAFSVLIALGGAGTDAAIGMIVFSCSRTASSSSWSSRSPTAPRSASIRSRC